MWRFMALAGVALLNFNLQAEVSSDFLVKVRQKFAAKRGAPISAKDFNSDLSNGEQDFIDRTQQHDYSDIFLDTIPKNEDVYSYNILHWQGLMNKLIERAKYGQIHCHMVYTEDGISFKAKKLGTIRNPPPEDFDHSKGWKFSYCAGGDKDADPDSVLFYFHGASGNPYNWIHRDATFAVRERWREVGKMPMWISVSLGKIGHMAEPEKEDRFFNVIVPYIEKKLGFKGRPKNRFGFGISQGGGNIVHAVLKNQNFFDAAVAVCPAVSAVPPSGSKQEWKSYATRTMASNLMLSMARKVVPKEFKSFDFFNRNVDALALGQKYFSENTTPLYIQTSKDDQFGLQEGGQILAILARTMGAPVIFEELKGGHCVLRPKQIADFFGDFQHGELPLQLKMLGRTRR